MAKVELNKKEVLDTMVGFNTTAAKKEKMLKVCADNDIKVSDFLRYAMDKTMVELEAVTDET